jgi:hypothetical protein
MELVSKYLKTSAKRPFSIADAVEREVLRSSINADRGIAEAATDVAERSAHFLGILIQLMHERGVLNDDFVIDFLKRTGASYEPYHQPDSRKE